MQLETKVSALEQQLQSGAVPPGLDYTALATTMAQAMAQALSPLVQAMATAVGGSASPGGPVESRKVPLQDLRANQSIKEFNNDKTIGFKRFAANIRGIAGRVPYGAEMLKDVTSKGAQPLVPSDYAALIQKHGISEEELKKFDCELRQVLEGKLGENVWAYVTTTPDNQGLELWRKLCHQYNPTVKASTAKAIEQKLLQLPIMKGPEDVTNGLLQFERIVTEHNAKAGVGKELVDQTLVIALMRIAPKAVQEKIILEGIECDSAALKERIEAYRVGHAELDSIQGRGAAMDIGSVSPGTEATKLIDALQKQVADLSSMVKGGKGTFNAGKGPSSSTGGAGAAGGNAWGSYQKGFGGFKGKGKGQKGYVNTRAAAAIANRRAFNTPGAQTMCPSELKFGNCTYQERTGRPCRYMHAKNVPAQLAAIDGLISSDFQKLNHKYDVATNTLQFAEKQDDAGLAATIAAVSAEAARVAKELEEENNFEFPEPQQPEMTFNGEDGSAPGFPGHRY